MQELHADAPYLADLVPDEHMSALARLLAFQVVNDFDRYAESLFEATFSYADHNGWGDIDLAALVIEVLRREYPDDFAPEDLDRLMPDTSEPNVDPGALVDAIQAAYRCDGTS